MPNSHQQRYATDIKPRPRVATDIENIQLDKGMLSLIRDRIGNETLQRTKQTGLRKLQYLEFAQAVAELRTKDLERTF